MKRLLSILFFVGITTIVHANVADSTVTPEMFGADNSGTLDAQPAFQKMVNYVLSRRWTKVDFNGKYLLKSPVIINFGQGYSTKGITFNGNSSTIFNSGGGFRLIASSTVVQHRTNIIISGFDFVGNSASRKSGITSNYVDYLTVENCHFYECDTAVSFANAGMCRMQSLWAASCNIGFQTKRMRDTKITTSHSFSCGTGFQSYGDDNASTRANTSGGVSWNDCTANSSTVINMDIKNLYAPVINGMTLEQAPRNLLIQSCQWGTWIGGFIGPATNNSPGSYSFTTNSSGGLSNDNWQFANTNIQGRTRLVDCRTWDLSNVSFFNNFSDNSTDNAGLTLQNCNDVKFANLNATSGGATYAMRIMTTTARTYITNGQIGAKLLIEGAWNGRIGGTQVRNVTISGGLIKSGNKDNESFEYIDNFGGKDGILNSPYLQLRNYTANEVLAGAADGVNKIFTLAHTPLPGLQMIFVRGLLQNPNSDYTITGNKVTLSAPPPAGSKIVGTYPF